VHVSPGQARWLLKLVSMTADAAAIAIAMVLGLRLRTTLMGRDPSGAQSMHILLGAAFVPAWLMIFAHYRLYSSRFLASRLEEFRRVVHATGASVLLMTVAAFLLQWYVARGWLVFVFVLATVTVTVERDAVRRGFARVRRSGRLLRKVVIVGANDDGLALCTQLLARPELGYEVVGFVDDRAPVGSYVGGTRPVLGTLGQTCEATRRSGASSVIVVSSAVRSGVSSRLVRELTKAGIHVELMSSLCDVASERLTLRPLGRFPVMYVEAGNRRGWRTAAKRGFDVFASALALLLLAPLLIVLALITKVGSRGPALYSQERVGMHGHRFRIYKFRTMVRDADQLLDDLRDRNQMDGPLFKLRDDPRVTRVGRLLRRLSLDELPQLWNVLRGEMTLVGPRPALPEEMAGWTADAHERLEVRPGLTGMWQVSGRCDATFHEYVRLDLYYVDNWSLWTDLAILAKTVPTVLARRGAY
jgi:exopolysaccharide biosynthesis polyprenyl glycosylphosphotransferase